jgi:hypothetical protein
MMDSEIMRVPAWRDVVLARAGACLIWVGTDFVGLSQAGADPAF